LSYDLAVTIRVGHRNDITLPKVGRGLPACLNASAGIEAVPVTLRMPIFDASSRAAGVAFTSGCCPVAGDA